MDKLEDLFFGSEHERALKIREEWYKKHILKKKFKKANRMKSKKKRKQYKEYLKNEKEFITTVI